MKRRLNIKFIYLFGSFIIIYLLCSCAENPVSVNNVSLNKDIKIMYGQSVYIPEEDLLITFQDVVEESRCPEGLRCFIQGTAKIKLFIRQGNDTLTDTVETYLPQSLVSIGQINNSYLFDVKDVEPYPKQSGRIDVHQYILTLKISHFTYGFLDSEIVNKTGTYGQTFITGGPAQRAGLVNYYPFETTALLVNSSNDTSKVQTDSTGRFISYIPAGEYNVISQSSFPFLIQTKTISVVKNKMTYVILNYNSGLKYSNY